MYSTSCCSEASGKATDKLPSLQDTPSCGCVKSETEASKEASLAYLHQSITNDGGDIKLAFARGNGSRECGGLNHSGIEAGFSRGGNHGNSLARDAVSECHEGLGEKERKKC